MKNRDYTLIIRDVTPADQQYVGWLFNALHELFAKLGSVGSVFKTEPSPEPEPAEKWIVEFKTGENDPFQRSANRVTTGEFISKAAAEKAIEEKLRLYPSSSFKRSDYRVRRVSPPEPAGKWIVEFFCYDHWRKSANDGSKRIFSTRAEARKAANAETDGCKYRVRQLDVPVEEQWIVEFKLGGGWHRSGNTSTRVVFNTQAEAQKAADAERDGFKYRVRQII